jgi:hypothetical protein
VRSVDGEFVVTREGDDVVVTGAPGAWELRVAGGDSVASVEGVARVALPSV